MSGVRAVGRRCAAVLLALCMLLSGMVWSGVAAAVAPLRTYTFTMDDISGLSGGNGSGKNLVVGAAYDYEGKASGKAVAIKLNQPYDARGTVDHQNAGCFHLQNASGKLNATVGRKYVVSAWVKSGLTVADDLYWSVGTHSDDAHWTGSHNYEEIPFESTRVTLQPGVWTKITATVDRLAGNGTTTNRLSFAAGFAEGKGDAAFLYVDNVTVEEYEAQAMQDVPSAAPLVPTGTLLGTQTFETGTLANFITNTSAGNFDGIFTDTNHTDGGSASLRATIKDGWNSQRSRPRIVVKLGDATIAAPFKVEEGKSYVVSFWLKTTKTTNRACYYVATMGASDVNSQISAQSGACHTLQVLGASNVGTPKKGGADSVWGTANEVAGVTLTAYQWTQIVATIPAATLDAVGQDNYLAIGFTCDDCMAGNAANWDDTPYYIDDIAVYEQSVNCTVTYAVNGGDTLPVTNGERGQTVALPTPVRVGYRFLGWYGDEALTAAVPSPYTLSEAEVTLYAKWEKDLPQEITQTQDFESVTSADGFVVRQDKPFVLSAVDGNQALVARVQKDYNRNFNRPLWAFQMGTAATPLEVTPGTSMTVTFKLMAGRDVHTVSYMLDTVNDLSALNADAPLSSDADRYRTMQRISSSSHGTLNADKNEVNNISLKKGEWITVKAVIPALKAHGTGTQYLVLALGDINANIEIDPYDLYLDDVTVTYLQGGQSVDVIYHTGGGEAIPDGSGLAWAPILQETERNGYVFDGWYADQACTVPVTAYPPVSPVHLYAGWIPDGVGKMTLESLSDVTPEVYAETGFDSAAVQKYYGPSNMYQASEANHVLADDGAGGKMIAVTYGDRANTSSLPYGFRLVGEDTDKGLNTAVGTVYEVTFRYRVDALPVTTEICVLEGSVNWISANIMSRTDHMGFDITAADVGKGWQTGRIRFEGTQAGKGVHLVLCAADYSNRAGTKVCFDDVKVTGYVVDGYTTFGDATRVENEHNYTPSGKAAIRLTTDNVTPATISRVVFADKLGDRLFQVNTVNIATVWLYAPADVDVDLQLYSTPDLTAMGATTAEQVVGTVSLHLTAGEWTRAQMEFALPSVAGERKTYLAFAVSSAQTATIYLDDASIGVYDSDPSAVQTYEDVAVGDHPNSYRFDGKLHGYYGHTVVSGIGYDGSDRSLRIHMQSDAQEDASRAVLFLDKKDATATVGGSYIVTFYAMSQTDREVTFGLGTTPVIDLSDRSGATLYEDAALTTVNLKAGEWQGASVVVSDLQGKSPDRIKELYLTLGAWFEGVGSANAADVYVDNVALHPYVYSGVARDDILCFENTDVFGFGKDVNLSENGRAEVVLGSNHTEAGYYSLQVVSTSGDSISGAGRPQFNLTDANGRAVRVEAGKGYRVSFWLKLKEDTVGHAVRYWLAVTDKEDAYTAASNALRMEEQVYETSNLFGSTSAWKQVSVILPPEAVAKDGYLRLGICGADPKYTAFYLDDIRVTEHRQFVFTGEEKVQNYEKYNLEDKDFIRYGEGYVSDEHNHTEGGGNALRLTGISEFGYNRNQMILTDPKSNRPYEFLSGRTYTLRFWMYCSIEYTDVFDLNAWLWGTDDAALSFDTADEKNSKNGTFEWDGVVKPITNSGEFIPDTWNEYVITFTPTNGKYMLMGVTDGSRSDGGYVYYLDDMHVSLLEPATVLYDANGGMYETGVKLDAHGRYVESAFVGALAVGPDMDPYLTGKQLKGWALDKDGKHPFDLETDLIPDKVVVLYAVWGNWTNEDGYEQIGSGNRPGAEEEQYKTEIRYEKVWTGNAEIPLLDLGDKLAPEDAEPVVSSPSQDDVTPPNTLPVWLMVVLIGAAVIVAGGGALWASWLIRKRRSDDSKEVA